MKAIHATLLLSALAIAAFAPASEAARLGDVITGQASVIDGDTINIHGQRIRLHGIDAPERSQRCWTAEDVEFRCGTAVARALDEHIAGRQVACQVMDVDRFGRIVGRCDVPVARSGEITGSMNRALAQAGFVFATPKHSKDYVADVDQARRSNAGLFAGYFEDPKDFRRRNGG